MYLDILQEQGRACPTPLDSTARLREHKLYAKFSKCEFWLDRVQFLRHVLTPDGISVDPSKVQDVLNWKSPKSVHQILQFLVLARYYRRFISDFSKIAQSMTKLLQKEAKFEWSLAYEEAFQALKNFLTTAPVLTQLDIDRPFDVYCDASKTGLGYVLM